MPTSTSAYAPSKPGPANNWSLLAVTGLALVAVLLACIGLGTTNWFEITMKVTATDSMTMTVGMFKTCTKDTCEDMKYEDQACVTGEKRSGTEMEMRFRSVIAMIIIGLVMSFAAAVTSGFAFKLGTRAMWIITLVLLMLSTATFGAGVVVFAHTVDDWMNCDRSFCDGRPCESKFGYSFALAATALAISFVNILVAIAANLMNDKPSPVAIQSNPIVQAAPSQAKRYSRDGPVQTNAQMSKLYSSAVMNDRPEPSSQVYQQPSRSLPAEAAPVYEMAPVQAAPQAQKAHGNVTASGQVLDDEWVYDATSSLYWSDLQQLYLDPNSNQYFDPASEQWYNPETGEWYTA